MSEPEHDICHDRHNGHWCTRRLNHPGPHRDGVTRASWEGTAPPDITNPHIRAAMDLDPHLFPSTDGQWRVLIASFARDARPTKAETQVKLAVDDLLHVAPELLA